MDINSAWKNACKVLLGDEIGDIGRYEGYLSKYVEPVISKKSSLSGKDAHFSSDYYPKNARFISQEEIGEYGRRMAGFKLTENQMKDLDSILEAIGEVAYYCGNAVLGNSSEVRESNRVFNSVNVYRSQEVYDSKHVAFSSVARYSEYLFGSNGIGETKFGIKNFNTLANTRCFESNVIYYSSDCYYVATSGNCTHCFFCFNLRNRSYSIGNVPLGRERYMKIREGLLEQVRGELERKKDLAGIIGLLEKIGEKRLQEGSRKKQEKVNVPIRELNSAFADTSKLLLGKPLGPMLDFREWLYEHVPRLVSTPSALGGELVHAEPLLYNLPKGAQACFVKLDESLKLGMESRISEGEVEKLTMANAAEKLEKIGLFTPEAEVGTNINVTACAAYGWAINALECWWPVKTKNAAYCGWSRQSENTFGCSIIFSSKFCVKCYNSAELSRCFEVSDSSSCTGCYFSHNVENCHDCMFCFNSKNLRYAVGNREIGREAYLKVKSMVLAEAGKRLERDKKLGASVYNVGSHGKK